MRVAILPVKHGNVAVALGPFDGTWEISSHDPLPGDLLIQLKGQISHKLARYCWEISPWTNVWLIALLWATWGGLALGLSSLWDYGLRTALLYGWIRLLFFGNGVWLLCHVISHWRGLKRARLIRNHLLDGDWEFGDFCIPERPEVLCGEECTEREIIEFMIRYAPYLAPWYRQLLKVEKPLVFRYWPLGMGGFLRQMLLGPEIPAPSLIFDVGLLE